MTKYDKQLTEKYQLLGMAVGDLANATNLEKQKTLITLIDNLINDLIDISIIRHQSQSNSSGKIRDFFLQCAKKRLLGNKAKQESSKDLPFQNLLYRHTGQKQRPNIERAYNTLFQSHQKFAEKMERLVGRYADQYWNGQS